MSAPPHHTHTAPELAKLSPWARTLLKRPLVEIRRGLSWGYDAPSEKFSVIVLTAPSGRYVDIRFRLSPEGPYNGIKPSDLFSGYATAGLSTATMPVGTETCPAYECTTHVQWEHPIDSARGFGTDSADMYLLANGDVMEIGTMLVDGKLRMFKEYWLEAKLSSDDPSFVVIETETSSTGKGLVIKVDNYCQGILQTESEFWVERWQLQDDGQWVKDPQSNTASTSGHEGLKLPCQWAIAGTKKLGNSTTVNDREWRVVEAQNND